MARPRDVLLMKAYGKEKGCTVRLIKAHGKDKICTLNKSTWQGQEKYSQQKFIARTRDVLVIKNMARARDDS